MTERSNPMDECQPVRKLHTDGTISVRLLHADGSEPAAGTAGLSAEEYPVTRLADERYQLHGMERDKKVADNMRWLSDNYPLLFEELLCFLEIMSEDTSPSITRTLDHGLTPSRTSTESYILAYYRHFIDTATLSFSLAADGWKGTNNIKAWSIFISTRTACGFTVEHPRFKAVMLAVWIMQDTHDPMAHPLRAKDNEDSIALIDSRFEEVYEARHELRSIATIDGTYIEDFLRQPKSLRVGTL